ncbi:hypothetical protein ACR3K2_11420 [Cryptosporidium serpentis]
MVIYIFNLQSYFICLASQLNDDLTVGVSDKVANDILINIPRLRPLIQTRNEHLNANWSDINLGLRSNWPAVSLDSAIFEFLCEFYRSTGRSLDKLLYDIERSRDKKQSKNYISTAIASDLITDNLVIKLMETLVINRWYSPAVESLRSIERIHRKEVGVSCLFSTNSNTERSPTGWVLFTHKSGWFDYKCSPEEVDKVNLINTINTERLKNKLSYKSIQLSNEVFIPEHKLEYFNTRNKTRRDHDLSIVLYIDFSSEHAAELMRSVINLWNRLKDIKNNLIFTSAILLIRHFDLIKSDGEIEFEYLTGYGTILKKAKKNSISEFNSFVNKSCNSDISHKTLNKVDEKYCDLMTSCDIAVNMENVIDPDTDLDDECIIDLGVQTISLSKRLENPLKAMSFFVGNFGTYQYALCKSLRTRRTHGAIEKLHEYITPGATMISINGRLVSPSEASFMNIAPMIKSIIFSRFKLAYINNINPDMIEDVLSNTGLIDNELIPLFGTNVTLGVKNDNLVYMNVLKGDLLEKARNSEIFDNSTLEDVKIDVDNDFSILDEDGWVGKMEYTLTKSDPWVKSSPRTDWRILYELPKKQSRFYVDIANIGETQWGRTPMLFDDVWFTKEEKDFIIMEFDEKRYSEISNNTSEKYINETKFDSIRNSQNFEAVNQLKKLNNSVEYLNSPQSDNSTFIRLYSPWMMFSVYFMSQIRFAAEVQNYYIYDIMIEPEKTMGQMLYPLEALPNLQEMTPEYTGIYPIKAPVLSVILLCDPLDMDCMATIIKLLNKKWPIRLNVMLVDPDWIQERKPDFNIPFNYEGVNTEKDFQARFAENSSKKLFTNSFNNTSLCNFYFAKNLEDCPEWIRQSNTSMNENMELNANSTGIMAIKLAISEIFGFFVSSQNIQGMILARAFLEMIAKNFPLFLNPSFTLGELNKFLELFFKHFDANADIDKLWQMIYSNNPNQGSYVNKALAYCRLKGFTSRGSLVNGYFIQIEDLDIEQVIYAIAKREQTLITQGVKSGIIATENDIPEYILKYSDSTLPAMFPPLTKSIRLNDWPYSRMRYGWSIIDKKLKKEDLKLEETEYMPQDLPEFSNIIKGDSDIFENIEITKADLLSLNYTRLWDTNPVLDEKKIKASPFTTFIVLVRNNSAGLYSLQTILDYWISTVSLFTSTMNKRSFNDFFPNRRFSISFINEYNQFSMSLEYSKRDSVQDSNFNTSDLNQMSVINGTQAISAKSLQQCFDRVLKPLNKNDRLYPVLQYLKVLKTFTSILSKLMNDPYLKKLPDDFQIQDLCTKIANMAGLDIPIENIQVDSSRIETIKKFIRKFSSQNDETVHSYPFRQRPSRDSTIFPRYVSYNFSNSEESKENEDRTKYNSKKKSEFKKPIFKNTELSNRKCSEVYSIGIAINGLFIRVCPQLYPNYISLNTPITRFSPIHIVHMKIMEFAITSRLRHLVMLSQYKQHINLNDVSTSYKRNLKNRWEALSPEDVFLLMQENIRALDYTQGNSFIYLEELYNKHDISNSIKTHLKPPKSKSNSISLVNVVATLDPLTPISTKVLSLLEILHTLFEANIRIVYNPILYYNGSIPIQNMWFRYVFNYPRLVQSNETNSTSVVKLSDLLYSSSSASSFINGKSEEYDFKNNTQYIAKFNIHTKDHLEIALDTPKNWVSEFIQTVVRDINMEKQAKFDDDKAIKYNFLSISSSIFANISCPILFQYKLKGLRQSGSIHTTSEMHNSSFVIQNKYLDSKSNDLVSYSLPEFGYFSVLTNPGINLFTYKLELVDYLSNEWTKNDTNNSNKIQQNKGIFQIITNNLISSPSKFLNIFANFKYDRSFNFNQIMENSLNSNSFLYNIKQGIKRELFILNILCISYINKHITGQDLERFIQSILNLNLSYTNIIIHLDNRELDAHLKISWLPLLQKKYNIQFNIFEIMWPEWLPELPKHLQTNIIDVFVTLDTWAPRIASKLYIMDPYYVNIRNFNKLANINMDEFSFAFPTPCNSNSKSDSNNYFKQDNLKDIFKADHSYNFEHSKNYSNNYYLTSFGIINLKKIKFTIPLLRNAYIKTPWSLAHQQITINSKNIQITPIDLLINFASQFIPVYPISELIVACSKWCNEDILEVADIVNFGYESIKSTYQIDFKTELLNNGSLINEDKSLNYIKHDEL